VRSHITAKALEAITAVLPLVLAVIVLQFAITKMPLHLFLQFIIGAAMIVAGIVPFLLGVEIGILPMGKALGGELDKPGIEIALVVTVE